MIIIKGRSNGVITAGPARRKGWRGSETLMPGKPVNEEETGQRITRRTRSRRSAE
jgi:hypothetical protein